MVAGIVSTWRDVCVKCGKSISPGDLIIRVFSGYKHKDC